MNLLLTTFATVFLAELGDKTQLATLLFAADKNANRLMVFVGAALALIVTTLIAVLIGKYAAEFINPKVLKLIAGVGFIAVGIWTLAVK